MHTSTWWPTQCTLGSGIGQCKRERGNFARDVVKWLIAIIAPQLVLDAINEMRRSECIMGEAVIDGAVKGKKSSTTSSKDTRAVLPMPSMLEIVDFILADRLNGFVDNYSPKIPSVYVGARKGTQVT